MFLKKKYCGCMCFISDEVIIPDFFLLFLSSILKTLEETHKLIDEILTESITNSHRRDLHRNHKAIFTPVHFQFST
jgi:hypothetical protein